MLTVPGSKQEEESPFFLIQPKPVLLIWLQRASDKACGFQSPSLNITEQSREVLKLKEMV